MKNFSYLLKVFGCLLLLSGVLCFTGCKKDEVAEDSTEEADGAYTISDVISGFDKYATLVDSVYVQDFNGVTMTKFPVSTTGAFKVTLPTPAASNLIPATVYIPSTCTFSIKNAQICATLFFCFKNGKRTNYSIACEPAPTAASSPNSTPIVLYWYTEVPFTASGTYVTRDSTETYKWITNKTVSLSLQKGWNKINYFINSTSTSNSFTMDVNISNTLPPSTVWTIH